MRKAAVGWVVALAMLLMMTVPAMAQGERRVNVTVRWCPSVDTLWSGSLAERQAACTAVPEPEYGLLFRLGLPTWLGGSESEPPVPDAYQTLDYNGAVSLSMTDRVYADIVAINEFVFIQEFVPSPLGTHWAVDCRGDNGESLAMSFSDIGEYRREGFLEATVTVGPAGGGGSVACYWFHATGYGH